MRPVTLGNYLCKAVPKGYPVLITGAPGVGKSDIVAQVAHRVGAKLIITHPVVSDPTDFKGQPWVTEAEKGKFHARHLPFSDLEQILVAKESTIFFLDDLGQAPPSVQAACMQLLLARRINDHVVSDCVTFISATNRRQDLAGVSGLLEPVKSRFLTILECDPQADDWVSWAIQHEVDERVVSFIRWKPDMLFKHNPTRDLVNSPSPRTVFHVSQQLKLSLGDEELFEVISGSAGGDFATQFVAFLETHNKLPDPNLVLTHPDQAPIPKEPSILYAYCMSIAYKVAKSNFANIIKYSERLRGDFGTVLVRDCLDKEPVLKENKVFIDWTVRHASSVL